MRPHKFTAPIAGVAGTEIPTTGMDTVSFEGGADTFDFTAIDTVGTPIIEQGSFSGGVFESAFFGLTGLHGLHVTLGAVLIGIITVRAFKGQYSAERHTSVSTVSMYWHFVDAIWIFLVVVLYVGAEFGV